MIRLLLTILLSNICLSVIGQVHSEYIQQDFKKPSHYYLLKTEPETRRASLKDHGIEIVKELGDHEYIVRFVNKEPLKNLPVEISSWPANNLWKLTGKLTNSSEVFWIQCVSLSRIKTDPGIEIIHEAGKSIKVKVDPAYLVENLLGWDEVLYVGVESDSPETENRVTDLNLNPNHINTIHHEFPEITGKGTVISIKEQNIDTADIDLLSKVIVSPLAAEAVDNHATEMATIAVGSGNSFVTGKGVARGAYVTASNFVPVLPDSPSDYSDLSVSVQNHSYGTAIENFYGTKAEAFDQSAIDNPYLLHVFSSGNQGEYTTQSGKYQGVPSRANLTGNYKMGKNVLVVGSVDTTGNEIPFSSVGPAYDGRVKPELVTYSMAGASNSAALVSGMGLLLQQQYQILYDTLLRSDLLKAILINSANDVGNPHVDFKTGYGNLNAYEAIRTVRSNRFVVDSIQHDSTYTFSLSVPANVQNLKLSLVWNDVPAVSGNNKALINDLDLILHLDAESWLPWVLDETPDESSLSSDAERGEDHLNNIEQITLQDPMPGQYEIDVYGYDISSDYQPFAIAYQWEQVDRFKWLNPTGSDNFPYNGETPTYFRWKSTYAEEIGLLEIQYNETDDWMKLEDVLLSEGAYRWTPPDSNSIARVRMTIGTEEFLSSTFTVSRPLRLTFGFNCADSVLIQWPKFAHATNYRLFHLGDSILEQSLSINDTAIVIEKSLYEKTLFAVQPNLGTKQGIQSLTYDYEKQGAGCYLTSFYSTSLDDAIQLDLRTGTTYGIDTVFFERLGGSAAAIVDTILFPGNTTMTVFDFEPKNGLNQYQVRIKFQNGQEIVSSTSDAFFFRDIPFFVFPNPVYDYEELRIFSNDFGSTVVQFELYNLNGQLIISQQVQPEIDFMDMTGLEGGMYVYHILFNDQKIIGKLVVR